MKRHLYFYIDDSGKISDSEEYSGFAGILFLSSSSKSEFSNKYKSILKRISCKYCSLNRDSCSKNCPEVKGSIIRPGDRRWLLNLSRQFYTFGVRITNSKLYPTIRSNKASKGRYTDYAIKRVIKEVIQDLLSKYIISADDEICINIYIDEMTTKSNGYYTLEESIIEELYHGISNFNYGCYFTPILKGDPKVNIRYQESDKQVGIQMADILANTLIKEAKKKKANDREKHDKKLRLNKILYLP